MAYQSLYRKYRPQTFSDVMGQGHVTRTLQNALASGRAAHGYLFTGTRGTAKTTVARLLAKALNCEKTDRPTPEPCNECDACTSITNGSCIDVIEMDAASHRGVADIEEVRKAVGYGPMQFRYKVFIIDEAHQLSSDAKDAFLKTLEEPPANVVFILATTEPQAIPITIRSRCQQFDFKRGSLSDIAARLRYVLDREDVTYTPEAVNLVARGAEGSWRDALSLLEQVLAFAPKHVTADDVNTVLGTLDAEMLARVVEAVAHRDAPTTFALAGQLLDSGKEARTLLKTLAAHFRDLLLVSVGGPAVAAELTPEEVNLLQGQARAFTPPQMMRAMDILNEAQGETRWNNQHRLLVELTFLKLMTLGDGSSADSASASAAVAPVQFATAPIVFASPQAADVPAPVSPEPAAAAAAPPPPVAAPTTPVPKLEQTSPLPEREDMTAAATSYVAPPPPPPAAPLADEDEVEPKALPAGYFSDDDAPDDDDEYDSDDFTVVGDEDDEAPVLTAPVSPVAASAPLLHSVIENEDEEENDEDAGPLQTGPGLFDDEPVADAAPPALTPVPSPNGSGFAGGRGGTEEAAASAAPTAFSGSPSREAEDDIATDTPLPPAKPEPLGEGTGVRAGVSPSDPDPDRELAALMTPGRAAGSASAKAEKAPVADDEEEPEAEEDTRVTLARVRQVWPAFMRDAARVSKQAAMMMEKAHPTTTTGKTVTISFTERMNHEIMNQPKKQEFVKSLLARCLGVESVAVRFVLDDSAAPAPARSASKKKAPERDPIAALKALDEAAPVHVSAPPPEDDFFGPASSPDELGSGGGFASSPSSFSPPPAVAAAPSAPPPAPAHQDESSSRTNGNGGSGYSGAAMGNNGQGEKAAAAAAQANRAAAALDDPLVQETLSIFGGEIVTDE